MTTVETAVLIYSASLFHFIAGLVNNYVYGRWCNPDNRNPNQDVPTAVANVALMLLGPVASLFLLGGIACHWGRIHGKHID